jgi:hypothetical protein
MPKPIFRWTCGPCLQQGLDILEESIKRTTETLGFDNFDWAICYNGLTNDQVAFVKKAIGGRSIHLLLQDWANCPIPDHMQTPQRRDGSFQPNGTLCGGTLWKACPARVRMESHEIVMDNDIILLNKFPQIDEFLQSNKTLILEEPVRFYGRYDCLFPLEEKNLNSGFMGFPPNYDYAKEIHKTWIEHGSFYHITQADEQGLLMATLNRHPNIRIQETQMVEILHREFGRAITGKEEGIHFTQANRANNHRAWKYFKEKFCNE